MLLWHMKQRNCGTGPGAPPPTTLSFAGCSASYWTKVLAWIGAASVDAFVTGPAAGVVVTPVLAFVAVAGPCCMPDA